MGFLADKRILITGVLSKHSIAYGIARACHREGAQLAFTYQNERFRDRVAKFAANSTAPWSIPATSPKTPRSTQLFADLGQHWDGLDGLVHSIAYAPGEAIEGDFLDGITRDAFPHRPRRLLVQLPGLAKAARPLLLKGRNPALLALSYLGAERTLPNYNTMGLAKASLEAATRYLAFCLGPQGIRANAISAGPIKTLAASGIGNFSRLLAYNAHNAPLRRNITIDEVGNAAAFMLSDLASAITGEIMYVDGGLNTTALGNADPMPG
ncbi:MAG: SDR family oxidoreductase [Candidatus Accumulibacter delftensis]|jgi:enoyl-[acyl-carrier protein] reductase I